MISYLLSELTQKNKRTTIVEYGLVVLFSCYFFSCFLIAAPACMPSAAAFAICKVPPMVSPAAYKPSMLVSKFSLTRMFVPSTIAPILVAKSTAPGLPNATNIPSTSNEPCFSQDLICNLIFTSNLCDLFSHHRIIYWDS